MSRLSLAKSKPTSTWCMTYQDRYIQTSATSSNSYLTNSSRICSSTRRRGGSCSITSFATFDEIDGDHQRLLIGVIVRSPKPDIADSKMVFEDGYLIGYMKIIQKIISMPKGSCKTLSRYCR